MTNKELLDAIRKEIEKLHRLNECSDDASQYEFDVACGYDAALEDVSSFLDTLQEKCENKNFWFHA